MLSNLHIHLLHILDACYMQIDIYESYKFLFIKQIHPRVQSTAHRTGLSAGMSMPRFAEGETEAGQEQRDLPSVLGLKIRSYFLRLATGIAFLTPLIPARKVILFFCNTEHPLWCFLVGPSGSSDEMLFLPSTAGSQSKASRC